MYLGTHLPAWLGKLDVPLFVSRRRMCDRRTFPRALAPWALDSGGFSELSMFGEWRTTAAQYVVEARRFRDEIGNMEWAAIQDWMCEPVMLAKTGLTIAEHQRRTIESYETLLGLAPEMPWTPVLQGWDAEDYHRHAEQYEARGHRLDKMRIVGVGSVCRRQATAEAESVMRGLAARGIRLHGFGFKVQGLLRAHDVLASADSMAWSREARWAAPIPGHEVRHKNCANCEVWALRWLENLKTSIWGPVGTQLEVA